MKREFDFDDCFKVLETLWSSLPPNFPPKSSGIKLFETKFSLAGSKQKAKELVSNTKGNSKSTIIGTPKTETAYSKVANLRRQTTLTHIAAPKRPTGFRERQSSQKNSDAKNMHPLNEQVDTK